MYHLIEIYGDMLHTTEWKHMLVTCSKETKLGGRAGMKQEILVPRPVTYNSSVKYAREHVFPALGLLATRELVGETEFNWTQGHFQVVFSGLL